MNGEGREGPTATQNMIFSLTYYLESRNAIIVYCASCFCINHGRIDCLDTIEHSRRCLVKKYVNGKRIQECVTPNSQSH
jgi:hypothetical protein